MNGPPTASDHPASWNFDYPIYHAETRAQWRAWLAANHEDPDLRGVWFCSWKRDTGRPSVSYDDMVEEALCFGWVDSTMSSLDDERSLQLVTRRKAKSTWASSNKERVARLRAAGLMTPAGEEAIAVAQANGWWSILDSVEALEEPDDLAEALDADRRARDHWDDFPDSARKAMLWWVKSAARDDTRLRRIAAIVAKAAMGERAQG